MNPPLLLAAEKAPEPNPIIQVIEHLSPHKYSWSPDIEIAGIDFSITNAVLNLWWAAAIVILLFWTAASRPRLVPTGVQNAIELARDWVRENLVYQVMSPQDGRVWGPFVEAVFFYILFMNAVGLIPAFGFTPTSNIFVTGGLAIMVYVLAISIGMAKNGPATFWKKTLVPPDIPKPMLVLMVPIEVITQLARPFSLAVRLFANMLADHVLLLIFVGFIFLASGFLLVIVLPFALVFEIVFTAFALFVAFIQAVIFAYLTSFYINDALHPGH